MKNSDNSYGILTDKQREEFERKYNLTSDAQKTYGQILIGIMKKMHINKVTAEELTGLKRDYFSERVLNNPDGNVEKRFVVSIGVGFGLDVHLTEYILESCGMRFNTNDRVDKAYICLLEEHKGKDIETCNTILKELGISSKHYLGTHERGAYKKKDSK